jgi:hypothetical protein
MNAMILYETFDFATEAKAALERVTRQTDETTRWHVNLWRVDVLKLPSAIETALAEAMAAHLIMFAVSHVQSVLQSLFDWLERWAKGRQFQEAALAVWDGGRADNCLAQIPPELAQFARHHGLSLLFDDNAVLYEVMKQPVRADDHHWGHWGINE